MSRDPKSEAQMIDPTAVSTPVEGRHGELIARLESATKGSDELSAHVVCAGLAPQNARVEQSRINGAWCICAPNYHGDYRLWERGKDLWRQGGWPVTTSIDAALALIERKLPTANCVGVESYPRDDGRTGWEAYVSRNRVSKGHWYYSGYSPKAPLALCIALLRALSEGAA